MNTGGRVPHVTLTRMTVGIKQIIRKATHVVNAGTAKTEIKPSDRRITTAVDVIPRAGCFMTAEVSHSLPGGARGHPLRERPFLRHATRLLFIRSSPCGR
jgi:hypothetical protein